MFDDPFADDLFNAPRPTLDLSKLNVRQREAVTTTEGPLLILAGAGSGKTRVLTYRVAHMVLDLNVPPEEVLAITFTNKATREMRERIHALIGAEGKLVRVGTFHRTCLEMVRSHTTNLGLPPKFSLIGQDEARKIITRLCADMGVTTIEPGPLQGLISRAKNNLVTPQLMTQTAKQPWEEDVALVYGAYDKQIRALGNIDLDDILVEGYKLLRDHPTVLATYHNRIRYIHVDEYQDTNRVQYEMVKLLAAKHQNLMVVGDDEQAIYSFRGADIRNILSFEKDYPKAKVIVLGENYRSSGNILAAAAAVIANNTQRRQKKLVAVNPAGSPVVLRAAPDDRDEARFVAETAKSLIRGGTPASEIAVLYRLGTLSSELETALLRAGVKYEVVRGTRYVDRKAVRDVMAYIATVAVPDDLVALKRISNVPRRGLGEGTFATLEEKAEEMDVEIRTAIRQVATGLINLPGRAKTAVSSLSDTLDAVATAAAVEKLTDKVRGIIRASGLLDDLNPSTMADQDDRADVLKLVDVADALLDENKDATLEDFLDFLALQSEQDEGGAKAAERVKLLTIHAAKGLEFNTVFVIGMEENVFPHSRALQDPDPLKVEEERRLAYVALTRAKERLVLSHALERRMFGDRKSNPASRFIREIPPGCLRRVRSS